MKKNILYIINSSEFFLSHFSNLAKHQSMLGNDVTVALGDKENDKLINSLGFKTCNYRLSRSSKNILTELYSIIDITKIIYDINPSVIHCFTIKPILYTGIAMKIFRYSIVNKCIFSITGLGSLYLSESVISKILSKMAFLSYKWIFSDKRSRVIFENKIDQELFIKNKICNKEISFLINGAGVNTKDFFPSSNKNEREKVVIFPGRLIKDKGILEYMEAAKILNRKNVPVRMMVAGALDKHNISKTSIFMNENFKYIEYLGFVKNMVKVYQNSDIACLPSYREGLSKSLVEATSCGLPIVTTDAPGCVDLISREKINGYTVPTKDANKLAEAIEKIISYDERLYEMGNNSRALAKEKFDLSIILNEFDKVYMS